MKNILNIDYLIIKYLESTRYYKRVLFLLIYIKLIRCFKNYLKYYFKFSIY